MAVLLQNGDQLLIQSGDVLLEQDAGAASYSLTAEQVSFSVTVADAGLLRGEVLTAEQGTPQCDCCRCGVVARQSCCC